MHNGPVEVFFQQALERGRQRALRSGKRGIQRVAILGLEVVDDEAGVGHDGAAIVDVGKLALGCFHHVAAVHKFVRQAGHAQVRLHFHAERAGIGQIKRGGELIELDHGGALMRSWEGARKIADFAPMRSK